MLQECEAHVEGSSRQEEREFAGTSTCSSTSAQIAETRWTSQAREILRQTEAAGLESGSPEPEEDSERRFSSRSLAGRCLEDRISRAGGSCPLRCVGPKSAGDFGSGAHVDHTD